MWRLGGYFLGTMVRYNGGLFFSSRDDDRVVTTSLFRMMRFFPPRFRIQVFKEASRHDVSITKSMPCHGNHIKTPFSCCLLLWGDLLLEFKTIGSCIFILSFQLEETDRDVASTKLSSASGLKGCGSAIASLDYAQSLKVGLCDGAELVVELQAAK